MFSPFRFASSKSNKIYLHTDIRMLIFRKSDADAATLHKTNVPYELRSFTHGPINPKFSPRKWKKIKIKNRMKKICDDDKFSLLLIEHYYCCYCFYFRIYFTHISSCCTLITIKILQHTFAKKKKTFKT